MPDFSVMQAVSGELRRQIVDVLDNTPDSDFGLAGNPDAIAAESPASEIAEEAIASLYLYHIDIDANLRNQWPRPDRADPALLHRPPLPLRLRFLFTPLHDEEATNLLVLGRVMQHFHDQPLFDVLPGAPLDDSHGAAPARLRVSFDMLPMADLTQIWSAFSAPLRLSVTLLVEIVAIESGRSPADVPRVAEATHGIGLIRRRP